MNYQTFQPHPDLSALVKFYWTLEVPFDPNLTEVLVVRKTASARALRPVANEIESCAREIRVQAQVLVEIKAIAAKIVVLASRVWIAARVAAETSRG